ncbi:MAG: DUF4954 family protein [Paludibacteraceae bacterium]|nr:DUF4954 family protein [Paludibacteraceae bacterium]
MAYRPLSKNEIRALELQGCSAASWANVRVEEPFSPEWLRDVRFSGEITLGAFEREVELEGGMKEHCGIYQAALHNCRIGRNAYIRHIGRHIANYRIGNDVCISDVQLLAVSGPTSFGNGTRIRALNEAGGREIVLYDRLSSQTASLLCLYRHRPEMIVQLTAMIDRYVASVTSETGRIGDGVCIRSCGILRNVNIGTGARLEGVSRLEEGSVNSCAEAPVTIGQNVCANRFILSAGSSVTDGCLLENCFVGQGTVLGKQFSLYDSVLMSNCQGFHGEACSIFGGPYTVTHHKNTLLIAGNFSFMNAGSASNQSNHLYKLGPGQQGLLARGCKTASGSYLLWPARIGAFTLVSGRHYRHPDTDTLPFSYLLENDGRSCLLPGVNLRSAGTARDAAKWPQRDGRVPRDPLDHIHFALFNPYTIGRALQGSRLLNDLAVQPADEYNYNGTCIPAQAVAKGLEYYRTAVNCYLGGQFAERLQHNGIDSVLTAPTGLTGLGTWSDLGGLTAPDSEINRIIDLLEQGGIATLEQLESAWERLYRQYADYAWVWTWKTWQEATGRSHPDRQDLRKLIDTWESSSAQLAQWQLDDARKEFDGEMLRSYGVNDDPEIRRKDFNEVRGGYDNNAFVVHVRETLENIRQTASQLRNLIAEKA